LLGRADKLFEATQFFAASREPCLDVSPGVSVFGCLIGVAVVGGYSGEFGGVDGSSLSPTFFDPLEEHLTARIRHRPGLAEHRCIVFCDVSDLLQHPSSHSHAEDHGLAGVSGRVSGGVHGV